MGKKKPKLPPGTFIERDLFESPAFLALRGFAPQLLILILGKRWFDKVGEKGKETVCKGTEVKDVGNSASNYKPLALALVAEGIHPCVHPKPLGQGILNARKKT